MSRWYADTVARYVEDRGHILTAWDDDPGENAVYVNTLCHYRRAWQHEVEAPREEPTVIEPRYGAVQASVLRYLREHGEAQATDIARSIALGSLGAIRSQLCAMEREGKVRRVAKGRYVLA